jgi:DNA-binding MarR family transcriptional regulator
LRAKIAGMKTATKADGGPVLGKVLDFMRLIWTLDHGLQSLSKRMQSSIGLTGPQRITLRVVGRRPGISAGALSDILRLHPSTLTGILHRLERRGLVRRTRDPEDRRRAQLALTARGRQLNVSTPGTVEAVVKRVLAGIPETRLRPAAELLAAVAAALLEEPSSGRGRRAFALKPRAPATRV